MNPQNQPAAANAGWLATSPHGPQRNCSWQCAGCPAGSTGDTQRADYDLIRAAARAHLEQTGHHVSVARGTLEMLHPMATHAQAGTP